MLENMCIFTGNLGQDPELRRTQSDKAVCNISLGVSNAKNETDWVPVVCWESTAENVCKYLKKGSKVQVLGRFTTRSWEDKDGKKQYKSEIVATEVKFLDGKPKQEDRHVGGQDFSKSSDNEVPW